MSVHLNISKLQVRGLRACLDLLNSLLYLAQRIVTVLLHDENYSTLK